MADSSDVPDWALDADSIATTGKRRARTFIDDDSDIDPPVVYRRLNPDASIPSSSTTHSHGLPRPRYRRPSRPLSSDVVQPFHTSPVASRDLPERRTVRIYRPRPPINSIRPLPSVRQATLLSQSSYRVPGVPDGSFLRSLRRRSHSSTPTFVRGDTRSSNSFQPAPSFLRGSRLLDSRGVPWVWPWERPRQPLSFLLSRFTYDRGSPLPRQHADLVPHAGKTMKSFLGVPQHHSLYSDAYITRLVEYMPYLLLFMFADTRYRRPTVSLPSFDLILREVASARTFLEATRSFEVALETVISTRRLSGLPPFPFLIPRPHSYVPTRVNSHSEFVAPTNLFPYRLR